MQETPGDARWIPGGGHGNPLQYSCLENPMDRGAWWATVHRVATSQTWLKMTEHTLLGTITIPTLYKRNLSFGKNELFALVTQLTVEDRTQPWIWKLPRPHHSMTIAHDRLPDNLDQHHLSGFSWKSSTVLASPLAQSSGLCFGTHLPQQARHSSV